MPYIQFVSDAMPFHVFRIVQISTFLYWKKNAASQFYGSYFGTDAAMTFCSGDHVERYQPFDKRGTIYQALRQLRTYGFPTRPACGARASCKGGQDVMSRSKDSL